MSSTPPSSPLISIITPAFNEEAFLRETIASVQAQTFPDWEWIIADNGSTDRTAAIVEAAAHEDPRIRLVRVAGDLKLAARTRNTALAEARAPFLAFLDADDLWLPEKLKEQLDCLEENPGIDGVCTWYELFGDAERLKTEIRVMRPGGPIERSELRQGCTVQTSTLMMRRRVYDEMGGMDEDPRLKSGQDAEYFSRMICAYRLYRMPRILARYRLAPSGGSLSDSQWDMENRRGWKILEILTEKNALTEEEARARRGFLYYEQARNNFFWANGPYRGALWRSIASGYPPSRAVIMFSLCFLPKFLLKPLLVSLQKMLGSIRRS